MDEQKICRLSDVVEIVNDNEYNPINAGVTKYVAGGHMKSEQLYVTKFGNVIEDKEVIGSAFHKLFKKGHILCGTRFPNLKKVGIATFDGLCANTTLVLQRKNDSDLIDGLLPFILQWDQFTEHAIFKTVGSTNPYVRWRDLANFRFVLPSTSEQIKLKELFWTIQNSIDRLEDLLEKTKNYAISRCESLLTRGIGHTKFKKVKWIYGKTIEIPEEWKVKELQNLAKISDGIHSTPKYTDNSDYYFINGNNLDNGKIIYFKNTKNVDKEEYLKYKLEFNDKTVLLSINGTIGNIAFYDNEKIILGKSACYIICNNDLNHIFLFYLLQSNRMKEYFTYEQSIATIFNLSLYSIRKTPIYLPDYTEQQQIESILSKINEQISQQQSHLSNLKTMRKSILNSKLTKEEIIVAN